MDEAGKQECKDCDVSETSKAGATICTKCDAGLFLSTSSLSTSDSKICRGCPGGYVSSYGTTTCSQCEPGYFSNGVNQTQCVACKAGQYGNEEGRSLEKTACQDCAAGTYSSTARSTFCAVCSKGKIAPSRGMENCEDCPAGWYQPQETNPSVSCTACPDGYVQDTTGASSCDRTDERTKEDCKAGLQYFDDTSSVKDEWDCSDCPPGADCSGNLVWKEVMPKPGHHRLTFDNRSFGKCPFPAACNFSFGGGCARGHDSNASELCSQCLGPTPEAPNGYAAQSRGEACEQCPTDGETSALFFGAIMLAVLVFAFLEWDNLDGANDMIPKGEAATESDSEVQDAAAAVTATAATTKMPFHSIVIRIVSSYLQIAGMLLQFDLHLPSSVRTLVVVEGSTSSLRYVCSFLYSVVYFFRLDCVKNLLFGKFLK